MFFFYLTIFIYKYYIQIILQLIGYKTYRTNDNIICHEEHPKLNNFSNLKKSHSNLLRSFYTEF